MYPVYKSQTYAQVHMRVAPRNTGKKNKLIGKNLMKRKKISRSKSKKMFSKHGSKTHKKNLRANPMRGGIRL